MAGSDDVKAAAPAVRLTYDDFLLFPDDGKRHELIDGEHYVTPSPNVNHQRVAGTLFGVIWTHLQTHLIGEVFMAPLDVVMSRHDVVEPDILYVSNNRRAQILTTSNVQGAPDLAIEVTSKGTRKRDETIKRRLYERGVSEYWVVDPEIAVVRIYRRAGDRFARALELSLEARDVLTTPLLPGLEIDLQRIFAADA
jgi:Uma2 family endonuclease